MMNPSKKTPTLRFPVGLRLTSKLIVLILFVCLFQSESFSQPPPPPSVSLKVEWIKDWTVNYPEGQSFAMQNDDTAERTIIHIDLSRGNLPYYYQPTITRVLIHEDLVGVQSHYPDVDLVSNVQSGGGYQPTYTPAIRFTVPWITTGCHNGRHSISVDVDWTPQSYYNPNGPPPTPHIASSGYLSVNVNNLLVQTTTPQNPNPVLLYPNSSGGVTPITLTANITTAYTAQDNVTLQIFDINKIPIKKFSQMQLISAGSMNSGTNVSYTWDGSLDATPPNSSTIAQPGVYLFQWYVSHGTYGSSFTDQHTDKSVFLFVNATNPLQLADADGSSLTYQISYSISENMNTPPSSATLSVYNPNFAKTSYPLNAGEQTYSAHLKAVSVSRPDTSGDFDYLITAVDNEPNNSKDHQTKPAQNGAKATPKYGVNFDFDGYPISTNPWLPTTTMGYSNSADAKFSAALPQKNAGYVISESHTNKAAPEGLKRMVHLYYDKTPGPNGSQTPVIPAVWSVFGHGAAQLDNFSFSTFWTGADNTWMVGSLGTLNAQTPPIPYDAAKYAIIDYLGTANGPIPPLPAPVPPATTPDPLSGMQLACFIGCLTALDGHTSVDPTINSTPSPAIMSVAKGSQFGLGFYTEIGTGTTLYSLLDGTENVKPVELVRRWAALFWKYACKRNPNGNIDFFKARDMAMNDLVGQAIAQDVIIAVGLRTMRVYKKSSGNIVLYTSTNSSLYLTLPVVQ